MRPMRATTNAGTYVVVRLSLCGHRVRRAAIKLGAADSGRVGRRAAAGNGKAQMWRAFGLRTANYDRRRCRVPIKKTGARPLGGRGDSTGASGGISSARPDCRARRGSNSSHGGITSYQDHVTTSSARPTRLVDRRHSLRQRAIFHPLVSLVALYSLITPGHPPATFVVYIPRTTLFIVVCVSMTSGRGFY